MATRNHPTEEQKRLSICLRDIIDEVIRCDFARDFMTLPKKGTPWEANYRNVVKNPIDLTTIRVCPSPFPYFVGQSEELHQQAAAS